MRKLCAVIVAASVALSGCGSSSNPAGPSNPGGSNNPGGPSNGSASMRVDGIQVNAISVSAQYANNLLAIGLGDLRFTLGFAVVVTGPGTYAVPPSSFTDPGVGNNAFLTETNGGSVIGGWHAAISTGGSGSVTITSLTSTAVAGTFRFTLIPSPVTSGGNREITEGQFNIRF